MSEALESAARLCEEVAAELDLAAQHCRTAARHFRDGEVPRAAAHAWAAHGHVLEADERLSRQAREHASEATSIARLLRPRSIAVIGANREPGSIGHAVFRNLIDGEFVGP
ncbi:MAG: hypothetical protein ACXWZ8_11710, partial [Gaiellaceae bacterium]